MNPTTILAGLLVVAFTAFGSGKLAAVPAAAPADDLPRRVAAVRRFNRFSSRSSASSACSSVRSSR